jgi:ribonuclease Z
MTFGVHVRRLGRRWVIVGAMLLVLGIAAYLWRGEIAVRLMTRMVEQVTANADPLAQLEDGLHVGICGAGSPMPDPRRGGPCTLVVAGRRLFVIDAGAGAATTIARMGLNPGQIEAIFLTHFHSDHIDGLGGLLMQRWVNAGASQPTPVYGPPGVAAVIQGVTLAYEADQSHRVAHHGEPVLPKSGFGAVTREFVLQTGETVRLIDETDLLIEAFVVDHGPVKPAVGYRLRYKDRSVVLSGDTRASDAVQSAATGADLLLHEALSPRLLALIERGFVANGRTRMAQLMRDIVNYHTTPEEAAAIAAQAKVGMLVLHHIVPPLPVDALEPAFLGAAAQRFNGPIHVAQDGDWFTLPAGRRDIRVERRP